MNANEFLDTLKTLKWKQRDFCRFAGVNKSTVSRWGQEGPPAWVSHYLGMVLSIDELHRKYVIPAKTAPMNADGENTEV